MLLLFFGVDVTYNMNQYEPIILFVLSNLACVLVINNPILRHTHLFGFLGCACETAAIIKKTKGQIWKVSPLWLLCWIEELKNNQMLLEEWACAVTPRFIVCYRVI